MMTLGALKVRDIIHVKVSIKVEEQGSGKILKLAKRVLILNCATMKNITTTKIAQTVYALTSLQEIKQLKQR